ncbi:late competence development ComFB family protein [Geosporobacter ferrireducens]|uniref:Competence protein ComFB n=1 Tax=Geosporobacter ferrireducens TaxID=1424294 RepID=A0A1D8GB79_9FIRM|nr:late competence development ComFB family protein [Geosporobacter ferrireducens]AOT68167.1 competence protein ComFB [Geosporobacter ferrireducens]
MLKNYMEDVVEHILPSMLKAFPSICTCEQCILDIKAITLNNLKPHYVVTQEGEVYSRVNEMYLQFETDVIRSIIHAIDIVSNNKRHH